MIVLFRSKVIEDIYLKYRENKLSHAYLLETNNIEAATLDIKKLVKALNCEHEYHEDCQNCNLCHLINKDNLPSLKIVEPDGSSIKKGQIEELKQAFSTIPVYSKYNIYIIKNAEKLNDSSANAMLKFVEEPTPGIIGFFLTNNKDVMIETIKSRCQSYIVNYETNSMYEKLNITPEEYQNYQDIIPEYLNAIAQDCYINNKKIILEKYPEREQVSKLIQIIFEIYYQTFLQKNGLKYNEEVTKIYQINENNQKITKKMQFIAQILQEMSYNVSIELILDKFVIEMRGITNE